MNHGHCSKIPDESFFSRSTKLLVPGSTQCQKSFLTIRYGPRVEPNPELDQKPNCHHSPPNGFVCSDWSSPSISQDLAKARKMASFSISSNYTTDHMRNPIFLKIWDRALQGSTHEELLSRYILGPCVSSIVSDLQSLVSHHRINADEAVVLQSLVLLRDCGSTMPLTKFRLQLLTEALTYFRSKTSSSKSKLLIELLLKRFKGKVKLVDSKREEKKAALGISLLMSQLKVHSFRCYLVCLVHV